MDRRSVSLQVATASSALVARVTRAISYISGGDLCGEMLVGPVDDSTGCELGSPRNLFRLREEVKVNFTGEESSD